MKIQGRSNWPLLRRWHKLRLEENGSFVRTFLHWHLLGSWKRYGKRPPRATAGIAETADMDIANPTFVFFINVDPESLSNISPQRASFYRGNRRILQPFKETGVLYTSFSVSFISLYTSLFKRFASTLYIASAG
jgi:hypothetical protein